MTPTDTEIRAAFANLRQLLVERFGEHAEHGEHWARMAYCGVLLAEVEFNEAVREHITAESLGEHN